MLLITKVYLFEASAISSEYYYIWGFERTWEQQPNFNSLKSIMSMVFSLMGFLRFGCDLWWCSSVWEDRLWRCALIPLCFGRVLTLLFRLEACLTCYLLLLLVQPFYPLVIRCYRITYGFAQKCYKHSAHQISIMKDNQWVTIKAGGQNKIHKRNANQPNNPKYQRNRNGTKQTATSIHRLYEQKRLYRIR